MFRTCLDLLHTYATVTTLVCDKICCFLVISFLYSNVKTSGFDDCYLRLWISHWTWHTQFINLRCGLSAVSARLCTTEQELRVAELASVNSTRFVHKEVWVQLYFLMLLFCSFLFLKEDELALTGINLIMIFHGKEVWHMTSLEKVRVDKVLQFSF